MKLARRLSRAARAARTLPSWCSLVWRAEDGLTISYAGRENLAPALAHLQWRREGQEVERRARSPLEVGAIDPPAADVRIVDPLIAHRVGRRPDGRLPVYLEAQTPLARGLAAQLESISNKPLRRKMRQVARGRFSWRVSQSLRDLHRFYRDLYLPFATSRFGDDAAVVPERSLVAQFLRGGRLVLAESVHGEHGALLLPAPDAPSALWWTKLGHSDPKAPAAIIEVAVLEYCISVGAQRLDWGLCPPVALDGLYVHKRRLGARFLPMTGVPTLPVFLGEGAGARAFDRSPIAMVRDGELELWSGGAGAAKNLDRCVGGGVPTARIFDADGARPHALS